MAGVDVKELEGKAGEKEEGGDSKPREFFWDSIVLFVLSSVLGLTAIDAITEFIRGSSVECFVPGGTNGTEITAEYISNFCSGSLPPTQFFPAFIVVSGVLIAIPHYLWLNHYGGNFEFFFSLASTLDRLRDVKTGSYSAHNHLVVQQLEAAFATYRRNTIFYNYVGKIFLQLVFSIIGLAVAIGYFRDFDENFLCPENATTDIYWPLDVQALCVFTSLRLIRLIRYAYLALLILLILSLFWAFFWCWCTHATELASTDVATFAFYSGLLPQYYVSQLPVPRFCGRLRNFILKFVTSISWFSWKGPRIHTDLDFMVMKLFRTDSGLGYVFKDVQVAKEIQNLVDDDQRRLNLHYLKHNDFEAEQTSQDKDSSEAALKWRFRKNKDELGVYQDFKQIPTGRLLRLPDLIQGAVLGFGAQAPDNGSAISVSFGGTGYATALARVFNWVGSVNFSPYYNCPEEPVSVKHYHSNVVTVLCRENILATETDTHNEFVWNLKPLWIPPNQNIFLGTAFLVVGPIAKDKELHLTTVDLFLGQIAGCLVKNAVLLTVRPLAIAGKNTRKQFLQYHPPKKSYSKLKQEVTVFDGDAAEEWSARNATEQTQYHPSLPAVPPTQHVFPLPRIRCGNTKCVIEFATYRYTDTPPAVPFYQEASRTPEGGAPQSSEASEPTVKQKVTNLEQDKLNQGTGATTTTTL